MSKTAFLFVGINKLSFNRNKRNKRNNRNKRFQEIRKSPFLFFRPLTVVGLWFSAFNRTAIKELFLFQFLGNPEARVELKDAADGEGYNPFLPAERAPAVDLHAHRHQRQHKEAASQQLLAAKTKQGKLPAQVFRLHLHQGEHQGAYAIDVHPRHRIHYKYDKADEHQHGSDVEANVLKWAKFPHDLMIISFCLA